MSDIVSVRRCYGLHEELTLNHDIIVKFAVEPIEELNRSIGTIRSPVFGLIQGCVVVHKCTEHDNAAVRLKSVREQIL